MMDAALKGHPYVKSGIDIACWDILGQATGLPVCELLGGRYGEDVHLYRAISQDTPGAMADRVAGYRAEGYRRFQLKVGGDPDVDIERIEAVAERLQTGDRLIADANTGWTQHEAMRVVRGVRDVDVYIEQPCLTYEECLAVRRHTDHPFVLDENIDSLDVLLRARADQAMDVVNLKISQARRPDADRAGARPVRVDGHRDDDRRQLGRRCHDRGDRPPGSQHTHRVAVHDDGFQQLRDGVHGRRGAPARERPHGRVNRARPRHPPEDGRPRRARRLDRIAARQ